MDRYHDAYHAEAHIELPLPDVEFNLDVEWGAWLEITYDPDNGHIDRLEDLED